MPVGAPSFLEALRCGAEIFHALEEGPERAAWDRRHDEGGFAPNLPSNEAALRSGHGSDRKAGYRAGDDVMLARPRQPEFYRNGRYTLEADGKDIRRSSRAGVLADLAGRYPIISIEDGMDESDWAGWAELTWLLGERIQLVGDDLFVTNTEILQRGIREGIANSILIRSNQIGTLTETLNAIRMADEAGYSSISSHRSGERPRTRPLPTSRSRPRRVRSEPARWAARPRRQITTGCWSSSHSSVPMPVYAGRKAFPRKLKLGLEPAALRCARRACAPPDSPFCRFDRP